MSKNVQNKASLARLPKIIKGIKDGKTYQQIAEECGVNENTSPTWLNSGKAEIARISVSH